jgi:hypothetical protein
MVLPDSGATAPTVITSSGGYFNEHYDQQETQDVQVNSDQVSLQ